MKITPEIVREFLHYDPDSGDFTWKERGSKWFPSERAAKAWNSKMSGKKAGAIKTSRSGYCCIFIRIFKKPVYAHRAAWMIMTGESPPEALDHINRDGTDNRWVNIRDAEGRNQRNLSMMDSNTSGITGVHWNKLRSKWQAYSHYCGKRHHLGYFDNKECAEKAVMRFRRERDFDPEHGLFPACYK